MKGPNEELLRKYFRNQCTKAEAKEILDWFATSEGQDYYSMVLDERIGQTVISDLVGAEAKNPKMLEEVFRKIEQREHLHGLRKSKLKYWLSTAAAISLIVAIAFVAKNFIYTSEKLYTTDYGEVKTIALIDGTKIILNANSELSYINERDVKLKGEAFFSVERLVDNSPFIVRTEELGVNVLGTEFNVNSRRKETEVTLNSGSVQLDLYARSDTTKVAMQPGDLVAYSNEEESYTQKAVNTEFITSWRNNLLIFDHTPFAEIQLLLEDNYGLNLEVKNEKIFDLEFTAELPADDVGLLLKLMEKSFNISIIKTNNKVVLEIPNGFDLQ